MAPAMLEREGRGRDVRSSTAATRLPAKRRVSSFYISARAVIGPAPRACAALYFRRQDRSAPRVRGSDSRASGPVGGRPAPHRYILPSLLSDPSR